MPTEEPRGNRGTTHSQEASWKAVPIPASGVVLDTVVVPVFRRVQVVMSLGSIVIVGLLASLYPAYRATRIDVAEAMKFEA